MAVSQQYILALRGGQETQQEELILAVEHRCDMALTNEWQQGKSFSYIDADLKQLTHPQLLGLITKYKDAGWRSVEVKWDEHGVPYLVFSC